MNNKELTYKLKETLLEASTLVYEKQTNQQQKQLIDALTRKN